MLPKGPPRDRDKRERNRENGKRGWKPGGPFIARSEEPEGTSDKPVHQRRFAEIRIAADLRHDVVASLKHRDRREDAPPFFAFDFERAETRQIDRRPCRQDEEQAREHGASYSARARIHSL